MQRLQPYIHTEFKKPGIHGAYTQTGKKNVYVRNVRDKSDTFTVDEVNVDLRHYIPILARRSRCFARTMETLRAVIEVFVDAYNRFGKAKYEYRRKRATAGVPLVFIDFF